MPYLGVGRLALAIITFSFVVYLIPGMWGAPLKGLSGYLPPLHTQDFVIGQVGSAAASGEPGMAADRRRQKTQAQRLPGTCRTDSKDSFDLQEAEAYAAKVDKPLFIDFTGHGCVNCREMEARVWSDPQVLDILRRVRDAALYSDDKKVLPESEWVTTDSGKVLKNLGKINSYYALKTYGASTPSPTTYCRAATGKRSVPPRGYDLNVENFVQFLRSGIEAYKKQQ